MKVVEFVNDTFEKCEVPENGNKLILHNLLNFPCCYGRIRT